jgi:hypothetical protein
MRERFETVIGLAAPFLDLVLAVGDRISRVSEPEDHEYYPVRSPKSAGTPEGPERANRSSGTGTPPGTD